MAVPPVPEATAEEGKGKDFRPPSNFPVRGRKAGEESHLRQLAKKNGVNLILIAN